MEIKIETKFKVGDVVYVAEYPKVKKTMVIKVMVAFEKGKFHDETRIKYETSDSFFAAEEVMFHTKEEAVEYMINRIEA